MSDCIHFKPSIPRCLLFVWMAATLTLITAAPAHSKHLISRHLRSDSSSSADNIHAKSLEFTDLLSTANEDRDTVIGRIKPYQQQDASSVASTVKESGNSLSSSSVSPDQTEVTDRKPISTRLPTNDTDDSESITQTTTDKGSSHTPTLGESEVAAHELPPPLGETEVAGYEIVPIPSSNEDITQTGTS